MIQGELSASLYMNLLELLESSHLYFQEEDSAQFGGLTRDKGAPYYNDVAL
jgi:hypothetical protein